MDKYEIIERMQILEEKIEELEMKVEELTNLIWENM